MSDVVVPELGESILEGTLLKWLKETGKSVVAGDVIAELETDKVNLDIIAEESGVLSSITKQPGDTVTVGEKLADISPAQEDTKTPNGSTESAVPNNLPESKATASREPEGSEAFREPAPPVAKDVPQEQPSVQYNIPPRATPSLRRLAREQGLPLDNVSQPFDGITTKTDTSTVGQALSSLAEQTRAQTEEQSSGQTVQKPNQPEHPDEYRERMSRRRQTIAKHLLDVKQNTAMLTTFNEIDMTNVLELRKRNRTRFQEENNVGLGFMSFFAKAAVAALKKFPQLNAEIDGQDMVLKYHYDIGIAVSTEGGLVVPVIRNVDRLNFAEIEQEVARLAEKARGNNLNLSDLQGGTFTITNGGVFGSLFSTPILNSPQVAILGMHGIQQRPIALNGEVVIRPMMYVALSYDHRLIDGSEAVRFLVLIKKLMEDPDSLLLYG